MEPSEQRHPSATGVIDKTSPATNEGGSLDKPMVSIYIPTRDRRELVARALGSVFAQTYPHYEVIVVDDGSTDGTQEFLEQLVAERCIRVFRFDSPRGAQAARNHALAQARCELVTGLDDDDEWLPERLGELVAALKPDVGFVAASDIIERENGTRYIWRRPPFITHDMLLRRNMIGNQVLARRRDMLACGAFDESLSASQDYDLWIRLSAQAGSGIGLNALLQIVYAHGNRARVTTSHRRKWGIWRVYRKYRRSMTPAQRKSHLFNLLRTTNRHINLRTATALWSRNDGARILTHWLRTHGMLSDVWLERIASLRDRRQIDMALKRNHTRTADHSHP